MNRLWLGVLIAPWVWALAVWFLIGLWTGVKALRGAFLDWCVSRGDAAEPTMTWDDIAMAHRVLSWCPGCGEAIQDDYCQNCRDLPAGWLEAHRAQLHARWQSEAQERAVLDRRAQEAAARAAGR